MIGRYRVLFDIRWEAYLFRNHGGIPSNPCDLEMLIFESWSCTPLSEIVSLGIFSMWAVIQI